MKNDFSSHWISSIQPRKQRKYRFNAPMHIRGSFMNANLAKDLRTKYGARSLRIRVGDEVKVTRGQFAGRVGKIDKVNMSRLRVYVAGVEQIKRDGTKKGYPLQPSNVMLIKLVDDKRRFPAEAAPVKKAVPAKKTTKKPASAPAAKA